MYDFHDNGIFEVELIDNDFKAVYSVGSTSALLAKTLFGINTYLIDLRGLNIHRTHFDASYDVLTRYGAEVQSV